MIGNSAGGSSVVATRELASLLTVRLRSAWTASNSQPSAVRTAAIPIGAGLPVCRMRLLGPRETDLSDISRPCQALGPDGLQRGEQGCPRPVTALAMA
eukprot:scaffold30832_cov67-Phaeocystis_antarctica.AAC.9